MQLLNLIVTLKIGICFIIFIIIPLTAFHLSMEKVNLYMLLLGSTPPGRHIEQHDILFSIGTTLASLKSSIFEFWPEAEGKIHVDAWRTVNQVDGFQITVEE